jgi:hypothetical protein
MLIAYYGELLSSYEDAVQLAIANSQVVHLAALHEICLPQLRRRHGMYQEFLLLSMLLYQ